MAGRLVDFGARVALQPAVARPEAVSGGGLLSTPLMVTDKDISPPSAGAPATCLRHGVLAALQQRVPLRLGFVYLLVGARPTVYDAMHYSLCLLAAPYIADAVALQVTSSAGGPVYTTPDILVLPAYFTRAIAAVAQRPLVLQRGYGGLAVLLAGPFNRLRVSVLATAVRAQLDWVAQCKHTASTADRASAWSSRLDRILSHLPLAMQAEDELTAATARVLSVTRSVADRLRVRRCQMTQKAQNQ
jgi:hypothetical protein